MRVALAIVFIASVFAPLHLRADALDDCTDASDLNAVISGCTTLAATNRGSNQIVSMAHNNIGNAYLQLKQPGIAIQHYNEAIILNPRYVNALYNRGSALLGMGDNEGALSDFDTVIRESPQFMPAYNNRALAHERLGDLTAAHADLDSAIALAPGFAVLYINRGRVLDKLDRTSRAVADFRAAIARDPTTVRARLMLADLLWREGLIDQATSLITAVLELQPDSADAKQRLTILTGRQ